MSARLKFSGPVIVYSYKVPFTIKACCLSLSAIAFTYSVSFVDWANNSAKKYNNSTKLDDGKEKSIKDISKRYLAGTLAILPLSISLGTVWFLSRLVTNISVTSVPRSTVTVTRNHWLLSNRKIIKDIDPKNIRLNNVSKKKNATSNAIEYLIDTSVKSWWSRVYILNTPLSKKARAILTDDLFDNSASDVHSILRSKGDLTKKIVSSNNNKAHE